MACLQGHSSRNKHTLEKVVVCAHPAQASMLTEMHMPVWCERLDAMHHIVVVVSCAVCQSVTLVGNTKRHSSEASIIASKDLQRYSLVGGAPPQPHKHACMATCASSLSCTSAPRLHPRDCIHCVLPFPPISLCWVAGEDQHVRGQAASHPYSGCRLEVPVELQHQNAAQEAAAPVTARAGMLLSSSRCLFNCARHCGSLVAFLCPLLECVVSAMCTNGGATRVSVCEADNGVRELCALCAPPPITGRGVQHRWRPCGPRVFLPGPALLHGPGRTRLHGNHLRPGVSRRGHQGEVCGGGGCTHAPVRVALLWS